MSLRTRLPFASPPVAGQVSIPSVGHAPAWVNPRDGLAVDLACAEHLVERDAEVQNLLGLGLVTSVHRQDDGTHSLHEGLERCVRAVDSEVQHGVAQLVAAHHLLDTRHARRQAELNAVALHGAHLVATEVGGGLHEWVASAVAVAQPTTEQSVHDSAELAQAVHQFLSAHAVHSQRDVTSARCVAWAVAVLDDALGLEHHVEDLVAPLALGEQWQGCE